MQGDSQIIFFSLFFYAFVGEGEGIVYPRLNHHLGPAAGLAATKDLKKWRNTIKKNLIN
jgi:hypothetical protein